MSARDDPNSAGLQDGLDVRRARPADGEALVRLLSQLHPTYPPDPAAADEVIEAASQDPCRALLVATVDDEAVGTADLVMVPNMTHGGRPWAVVENVVIDEPWRGQGIGRALMDEIDVLTRAAGCYMVQLVSLDHRHGAHAFYTSIGYASNARGFRHYLDGFAPTGPAVTA